MQQFSLGQRWISDSESELGLGLVVEIQHRTVTLDFPQVSETRLYARNNAPLSRISFSVGDEIRDREQQVFKVVSIDEVEGILVYQARPADSVESVITLVETSLSDTISLNQPLSRLLSGQVEHSQWFQLRNRAFAARNFIEKSSLLGLCSARTELIPHQLYIANEVAQRYAPRVLLADEVGLGKTIEACLILQQQLFTGLASRILILVPESLLHQWLVELLRRFNLAFSVLDEERCAAIIEDSGENPFFTEQLVLCSSELFIQVPGLHQQALQAEWDLLVVDEAHHLKPLNLTSSESGHETKSTEAEMLGTDPLEKAHIAYQNVAKISDRVKGLILLTATPDQLGQESHFALLKLLDPSRFHDFKTFLSQQEKFSHVATLIEQLVDFDLTSEKDKILKLAEKLRKYFDDPQINELLNRLNKNNSISELQYCQKEILNAILDRHGTGRVLFRNTRKIISGFPERKLIKHPLINPELYSKNTNDLYPEKFFFEDKNWLKIDPRVEFVIELINRYQQEKILLICGSKNTAVAIEEFLRLKNGIKTSVFHEGMSLLERDRSAAYFADMAHGSSILLCSEIGSEGRNFQFSHHLVLFDLPLNPDLLEQRIGRLDRIGQKHTIHIHVPYLKETAQEKLFQWYDESLSAFQKTNPAAYKVFKKVKDELNKCLQNSSEEISSLIHRSKEMNKLFLEELNKGRDRFLEINSFNLEKSQDLLDNINELELSGSPEKFLNNAFDIFGIDTEQNSDQSWTLNPSDNMVISSFSAIPDQGLSITYQRQLALHREDVQFVNWYHPIIEQAIDIILQGNMGKSSLAVLQDKRLESGSLLLESIYRIQVLAPHELQVKRFLPTTTMRLLVDSKFRNLTQAISEDELNGNLQHVDKAHLMSLLTQNKVTVAEMSARSSKEVQKQLPEIVQRSSDAMQKLLTAEIQRLLGLQKVNSNIRSEEINYLEKQKLTLLQCFDNASLQLEGLRLIFIA